jgi:hypothetical protein
LNIFKNYLKVPKLSLTQILPTNAWIISSHIGFEASQFPRFTIVTPPNSQMVKEGDWITVANGDVVDRIGRVLGVRSDLERTSIYFDRLCIPNPSINLKECAISVATTDILSRIQWDDFETVFAIAVTGLSDDELLIKDQAYIRELLQLALKDDLLGPAEGPHEQIIDMGVKERYLVGRLAPLDANTAESPILQEDGIEDDEEYAPGIHEPGAEFGTTTGRVDPDADAADEIDVSSNQSLVPSSLGFTFCVDADVDQIELDVRFGRYERVANDMHDHIRSFNRKLKDADGNEIGVEVDETKVKVWQRFPSGGKLLLPMVEGFIPHRAPDSAVPEVRVQGSIRAPNANGDRLVTIFLVNAQKEPETNRDAAWIFQPELIVRAPANASSKAIFRRRPVLAPTGADPERDSLEMIYRNKVEFAVGHGVAVHATPAQDLSRALEVRTIVIPEYEVPVTETPGERPEDRPEMQRMVREGWLDMQTLSTLDRDELVAALSVLTNDYESWIKEQKLRIGVGVKGFDQQAKESLQKCDEILQRLRDGIETLKVDAKALQAFRFTNEAMAIQRVRSMYSLAVRRHEDKTLDDFNKTKNRSWRPFQLAFLLLSIPSLANPLHKDRIKPIESYADLLWFPTGGGKTEAYLGVAAFTMAIRRLQGNLAGYDGMRGLAVIMRYTLRLLTLQQFQRATALICAMEFIRRKAHKGGDKSLGAEPFTIGLWVGNTVTPGTTQKSHDAISAIRSPGRNASGLASPAQLTSCPWCGSEISAGRDIEVNKDLLRTSIYCSNTVGRCDFSKGGSNEEAHPGLPVVVVDEEIYHRPPTMLIATVDKFAMMAWRGEIKTLFGRVNKECLRHGLLWPGADCSGTHPAGRNLPRTTVRSISPIRPPDLIIQDEFHLISGPLGTMVGLYESAIDELCSWNFDGHNVRPKVIASTATVRKADQQVKNVFMRQVSVFPPSGLDIEDNFFSVQRSVVSRPGRRYIGICAPGSSRPAMLIRTYVALLTAAQNLFEHFGSAADPYMTTVGYFNSLRELGSMKRMSEDDVQTRSFKVARSLAKRPGLAQRRVNNICELTSRVSNQDIPKYLDQLEVKFKPEFDPMNNKFAAETRGIDIVLATNMLSVGVDINRIGLMAVNGQPKGTAEYIQATSRVGRASPGLVCTVLTWAKPRDLSHYETFEHYHATFYKHVEAQSVTPFSPRAMDRGLTGVMLSVMRLKDENFSANEGAANLHQSTQAEISDVISVLTSRAGNVAEDNSRKQLAQNELKSRADQWAKEAAIPGRKLAYEKKGPNVNTTVALIRSPGIAPWDNWTVPMSMREVEPGVKLIMNSSLSSADPEWKPRPIENRQDEDAL